MGQQRTVSDAINDLWTKGIKPVDDTKAPLKSPALTGTPTAPTPAANDNSTKIATTAYVAQRIQNLINAAPAALDTLGEIATALKNNPNAIQEILTALGNKADKTAGTSSTLGLTKLYTSTGSNTDGTMTQKAINDALTGKLSATLTAVSSASNSKCLKLPDGAEGFSPDLTYAHSMTWKNSHLWCIDFLEAGQIYLRCGNTSYYLKSDGIYLGNTKITN